MKKIIFLASALIFTASMTVFGQVQPHQKTTTSTVTQDPAKPASTATPATESPKGQKTHVVIAANELPKAAQEYITKTYPGKKIEEAWKITEPNGAVMYNARISEMMLHFDSNGKFTKETKIEQKSTMEKGSMNQPAKSENKKPAEPEKK
jgi:hypothetical protein